MTYREVNENMTLQKLTSMNTVRETKITIDTQEKLTRSLETFYYPSCTILVNLLFNSSNALTICYETSVHIDYFHSVSIAITKK